jgi:hypothetical protein
MNYSGVALPALLTIQSIVSAEIFLQTIEIANWTASELRRWYPCRVMRDLFKKQKSVANDLR